MATLLKNLYSQEFIKKLSNSLQNSYKEFKKDEFKKAIFTNSWESLELKQRMRHISKTLKVFSILIYNWKQLMKLLFVITLFYVVFYFLFTIISF